MNTAQTVDPDLFTLHIDDIRCLAVRYHAFCEYGRSAANRDRAELWGWMLDEKQKETGVVLVDADTLAPFLRNRSN